MSGGNIFFEGQEWEQVTLTASGSWTAPTGVYAAYIRLVGGGGGGGAGLSVDNRVGGNGGEIIEGLYLINPGQSISFTRGNGGIGGDGELTVDPGGNGGNSVANIGAPTNKSITAFGGAGGNNSLTTSVNSYTGGHGAAPGSSNGENTAFATGGVSFPIAGGGGGGGGASWGNGGNGGSSSVPAVSANANTGGGGGGGSGSGLVADKSGGNGGSGVLIIYYKKP